MFGPRIRQSDSEIVISERHWTADRDRLVYNYFAISVLLSCAACGCAFYHAYHDITLAVFIGLLCVFPAHLSGLVLFPLFLLLALRRTAVRITPSTIEVAGVDYRRGTKPVHFSNLSPQAAHIHYADGDRAVVGMMDDTHEVRMFYGGNAAVLTSYFSSAKAGRFALACNSALQASVPDRDFGSPVLERTAIRVKAR